jgi:hypothetical protein
LGGRFAQTDARQLRQDFLADFFKGRHHARQTGQLAGSRRQILAG